MKYTIILFIQFLLVFNAFSQFKPDVYINEARSDIKDKNYPDAIQKLDVYIKLKPGEYEAYFLRGICKYFLNDNIGAEQDLDGCINIYSPFVYDAFHYRSFVMYRMGKYTQAINDVTEVIKMDPSNATLYVERAFSKLANQDYSGAINDCNIALRKGYMKENTYLCKGMAENLLAQFDSSLVDLSRALKINPQNDNIYVRIGVTYADMGNYNTAIEQYNKALKIDTGYTFAYYSRAEAELKSDNYKAAWADYNRVIKYDPMNSPAYFNRAVLETDNLKYNDAIADFDQVLVLNPENIQALFNRARLKTAVNDLEGALADYNKTIELFPYFTEAYYNRAKLKERLKDHTGAKADYNMADIMSRIDHSNNVIQRANDSSAISHLSALNADFSSSRQKTRDTINIDILPIFYMVTKDKNLLTSGCFPVFLNKSNKEFNNLWLTDKATQNNKADSLVEALGKEIQDSTKTTDIQLQDAVGKTNLQLFNNALKEYNQILRSDTEFVLAYFARGVDLCKEIEMLNRFTDDEQYTMLNKTYHLVTDPKSEKYKKALTDFNKVIQMEPDFIYAYYDRAYVKYKLHDYAGAVEDYNRIIKIAPDFANAYYNRGLLLFYLRDNLNACQDFSKAGELGLTQAYTIIKQYCSQNVK